MTMWACTDGTELGRTRNIVNAANSIIRHEYKSIGKGVLDFHEKGPLIKVPRSTTDAEEDALSSGLF